MTKSKYTTLVLFASLLSSACSLEQSRFARINSQSTFAAAPPRPEADCRALDAVHVWGDWSAGASAAVGTGAGVVAASTSGDTRDAALATGIAAGAVTATLVAVAAKSESLWTERCSQ
jgi:hypothetical protein